MTLPTAKKIELFKLDDLIPYEFNARLHTPAQVKKIAKSIAAFGFNNPILVDSQKGIVAGHGRLAAARYLGLEAAPVIVLDHLSEDERRAYVLADNRLAELAEWDEDTLSKEVQELQGTSLDLEAMGWTDDELSQLAEGLSMELPPDDDDPTVSSESNPETVEFRFEFSATDHAELDEMLDTLRRRYKLESSAETFEHLVRGAHG